jgi:hypothetical protein
MRARHFLYLASAMLTSTSALAARPLLVSRSAVPHHIVHASKDQTLYDQMGGDRGTGINSQNYEQEFDAYDDEAADDFIVPAGVRWKVMEVDMAGYYNEGPADSMNVVFYKDRRGRPGKVVAQFTIIPPWYNGDGGFPLDLDKGVVLKPGHYWLSIQANQDFNEAGQWSWASSDEIGNSPAMWRNPGGGFEIGCTEWTVETTCIADGQGDHLFALKGKSR